MKKLLLICLVLLLAVSVVGCRDKIYEVTFETNGGSEIAAVNVEKGDRVEKPEDPTKAGMVFDGWCKDEALTDEWNFEEDTVEGDIILYAKWSDAPHVHTYTSEVTPPTCTADGYTTYTCACGDSYTDGTVSAKGHTVLDVAFPCTEDVKCTVCDTVVTKAPGHVPGPAATCTEDQKCTVCDAIIAEDFGHSYDMVEVEPTCLEAGYTTYTCTVCGDSYTNDGEAAKGHTPGTAATCTTNQYCTVCGEKLADAKGHTPGAEATCTAPQTCTVCGDTVKAALGHVPVEGETCDNTRYCDRCKETLESFDHTFYPATCTEPETCQCGVTRGEPLGHNYVAKVTDPTCIDDGYTTHTCSRCEDSYTDSVVDAKGHTPGAEATCTTSQNCTTCGEKLVDAKGHTPGAAATCTNAQLCTVCGDTLEKMKDHTPGDAATCTAPQTCTVCGTVINEPIPHSYTDGKCDMCGQINPDWIEITYRVGKGTNDERNVAYYDPSAGAPVLYDPTFEGYTFKGWYSDSSYSSEYKVTSLDSVTEDITLYALWVRAGSSGSSGGSGTTTPEVPLG